LPDGKFITGEVECQSEHRLGARYRRPVSRPSPLGSGCAIAAVEVVLRAPSRVSITPGGSSAAASRARPNGKKRTRGDPHRAMTSFCDDSRPAVSRRRK
jgi:hypothetical protein